MAVQFYLVPISITDDENDYRAVTVSVGPLTEEDIINRIAARNTGVPVQSIRSVAQAMREVKQEALRDGFTVIADDTNLRVDIAGVFNGKDDVFDPARHQLRINPRLGKGFMGVLRDVTPVKINEVLDHSRPNPTDFVDMKSVTVNATITPGGIGRIKGMRLSFDETNAEQGIFFINQATKAETRVAVIAHNKPGQLIFGIPETLEKGDYEIAVCSNIKGYKDLKTGKLPDILSVL